MPIIPDTPSIHVYAKALSAFTQLLFNLGNSHYEQYINSKSNPSIAETFNTLLTENLYNIFHTQYKGVLYGLNIRYKEYKGTDTELEWLNNIVEDSAD
ncbi:hypothetical protein, partial [Clostridium sp. HBUAS56017]|uniref:hypothetical protein n=1 Tax=Clostridium sp. HBUAS56017 TaxID=2571128 RepID=UPI0011783833